VEERLDRSWSRLYLRIAGELAPDSSLFTERVPANMPRIKGSEDTHATPTTSPVRRLRRPRQSDPPPSPQLMAAVPVFRRAGFFALYEPLSDVELARSLAATWRAWEGDELSSDPGELDWMLVVLDEERTFQGDSEADVLEGNNVYVGLLRDLARRSGGALTVRAIKEEWASHTGSVDISLRANGNAVHLALADCGDWIDPKLLTEVNGLLSPEGPHFFVVDTGGQNVIITRATEEERRTLEEARSLRLSDRPPPWWESVRRDC